jgi:hypothetical protein
MTAIRWALEELAAFRRRSEGSSPPLGYLQVQDGGRTHATADPLAELSPGMQMGDFGGAQVTLHLAQGGGPSTLHDAGLVMSHCGVGAGVGPLGAVDGAAIASEGDRRRAISRIIRAIIWSLPRSLCLGIFYWVLSRRVSR